MISLDGLTAQEAAQRQKKYGFNALHHFKNSVWRRALAPLWTPIAWLLEAAALLEFFLRHKIEGAIIVFLLLFNALISFIQEAHAQATLKTLQARLALTACVYRNRHCTLQPATELVPGDLIRLSLGNIVPADARILEGILLVDQSMLTGESLPIEAVSGKEVYTGSLVSCGEAFAEVTAIGKKTKFGRTAELVLSTHTISSQQKAVLRIVRNLALVNGILLCFFALYSFLHGLAWEETLTMILTGVLASIPVALPAIFTVGAALGARALADRGVLLTRLSAMDEAASMDLLCVDKTGTLTCNKLHVTSVLPLEGWSSSDVLAMAALTSSDAAQDLIDKTIKAAFLEKKISSRASLLTFTPFNPETKMAEAFVQDALLGKCHVVKGAFAVIQRLTSSSQETVTLAEELEAQGHRVLAVGVDSKLIGLIALSDPPQKDAPLLIEELKILGVRTIMATGDAPTTALSVAKAVGLDKKIAPPEALKKNSHQNSVENFTLFAGILPEDKLALIQAFQKRGHIVGMCGDGTNDAPALRQSQIGIAVSTATDVAKSAAGLVLMHPGLSGIVTSIKEGRIIFQRLLTYILSSITKKIVQVVFLGAGLFMTGHALLTPLLMVFIMIIGDFLGVALTTDNVSPSPKPNSWSITKFTVAGIVIGISELCFCITVTAIGYFKMRIELKTLCTLAFLSIVFGHQAMTYCVRARRQFWKKPYPSYWLFLSSALDIAIAVSVAGFGILMSPLPGMLILSLFGAALLFMILLDYIKRVTFTRMNIR